ncbi:MAG: sigma-70 family RNA polymerase sigma factor [Clostridium sp.]|nr:sigma-70 family RNA polymerase sigma factor [Clostridium sp.]MCM1547981.1 sigma-70 family RNA polymerase sigma factor [Ruminococcus sp.]
MNKPVPEENLGLVHLCANRLRGRGIEYDDLYSAGCIGLLKAAEAFDCERGIKFSTYAVPVILGEIKRLFRDGGAVKVSRSLKELSLKAVREREELSKQLGREPTVSELSLKLGISETDTAEALAVSMPPVSLTDSNDENGGGQIDIAVPSPDAEIGDSLALRQVIELLEPKDRELIILRYYKGQTQSVAAKKLGMTQVQVSRREKKLLAFMREQLLL